MRRLVARRAVEIEPNDTPETATAITLPFAVNGRFETPKDRDYFEIQGKKGERYLISGRTRSMGSPADLFLRLHKADGALLVEAEDAGTDDGVINYTFPEDGVYRLMVEDLLRRGGPEFVYRIEPDGRVSSQPITVDYLTSDLAVVQGLQAGNKVVTEGGQNLRPGLLVTVMQGDAAP